MIYLAFTLLIEQNVKIKYIINYFKIEYIHNQ